MYFEAHYLEPWKDWMFILDRIKRSNTSQKEWVSKMSFRVIRSESDKDSIHSFSNRAEFACFVNPNPSEVREALEETFKIDRNEDKVTIDLGVKHGTSFLLEVKRRKTERDLFTAEVYLEGSEMFEKDKHGFLSEILKSPPVKGRKQSFNKLSVVQMMFEAVPSSQYKGRLNKNRLCISNTSKHLIIFSWFYSPILYKNLYPSLTDKERDLLSCLTKKAFCLTSQVLKAYHLAKFKTENVILFIPKSAMPPHDDGSESIFTGKAFSFKSVTEKGEIDGYAAVLSDVLSSCRYRSEAGKSEDEKAQEMEDEKNPFIMIGTQYKSPQRCMRDPFVKDKVIKHLASGSNGDVYDIISDDPSVRYVLKIQGVSERNRSCTFINEAKAAKKLGDKNVGPKVHSWWVCEAKDYRYSKGETSIVGFIVSDKMDMTINSYSEDHPDLFLKNMDKLSGMLRTLVQNTNKAGYIVGDGGFSNIMINFGKKISRGGSPPPRKRAKREANDTIDFDNIVDMRIVDFGGIYLPDKFRKLDDPRFGPDYYVRELDQLQKYVEGGR